MKKIIVKGKELISIMINLLRRIPSLKKENFINDEYYINIGTLYKRSIEESNQLLRFKERFKLKYQLAYSYAIENMGR